MLHTATTIEDQKKKQKLVSKQPKYDIKKPTMMMSRYIDIYIDIKKPTMSRYINICISLIYKNHI
jgi:hypothetical protein